MIYICSLSFRWHQYCHPIPSQWMLSLHLLHITSPQLSSKKFHHPIEPHTSPFIRKAFPLPLPSSHPFDIFPTALTGMHLRRYIKLASEVMTLRARIILGLAVWDGFRRALLAPCIVAWSLRGVSLRGVRYGMVWNSICLEL